MDEEGKLMTFTMFFNGGLIPTYFTFTAESWEDTPEGPMPTALTPTALPLFLEGPVRQFKLTLSEEKKRQLAYEALVILGMLALLTFICRLWPILLLIILGIFIAAIRLFHLQLPQ